jgi:hypothetical protein
LLECEHKWSLDLAWTMASALTGDPLGYGVSRATLWRALRRPLRAAITLPYPGYGAVTLFSRRDLRRRLAAVGLRVEWTQGIHVATNLIPSIALHRPHVPRPLAALYRVLRAIDTTLAPAALANSVVLLAVKPQA